MSLRSFSLVFVFFIGLQIPAQVSNENCSGAINVNPSEFGVSTWQSSSLGNSSSGASCAGNSNDDVWFKFTARSSNDIILAQDPVAVYDVVVDIYSACGSASLGCSNAYPAGQIERYTAGDLVPGQQYFFRVFNADASAGEGQQVQVQVKTFAHTRLRDQDCGRMNFQLQDVMLSQRNDLGQLYQTAGIGVDGYGFKISSQDGSQSITIQQTTGYPFSLQLVNIPFLQYGQTYNVQVQHRVITQANGSTQSLWSHFGEVCLIGLTIPPSTQLSAQYCNVTVNENSSIIANQVTGADLYRFSFSGPEGIHVTESPNYGLLLSTIGSTGNLLIQGNTYQVTVIARINGSWSLPGTVCSLTLNCQDLLSPHLSAYPANVEDTCGNIPAALDITASDTEAGSLPVILETINFSATDAAHNVTANTSGVLALTLPGINGVAANYTWTSSAVRFIVTNTGAYLLGELVSTDASNARWEVHIALKDEMDWASWSSLTTVTAPFIPRTYKDDTGLAASQGNAWTTWTYYTIDGTKSFLRGKGSINGAFLNVSQSPSSLQFGFQAGNAANNQSLGMGFSSWFFASGVINGQAVNTSGTMSSGSESVGTMSAISCQPWVLRKWSAQDPCGNKMITDQLITYPTTVCQAPTGMDAVEIGFGTMNPRVNGIWNNPEGGNNCQVRGGRLANGSYENGTPQFHNITNTHVIGQTNGSSLNFNIALYNNPNIPFKLGKYYGFEVRCACANGSGYSDWSGLTLGSSFLVPYPPGVQEGTEVLKSLTSQVNFRLYPNPGVGDNLHILVEGLEENQGLLGLQIFDILGRLVNQSTMSYRDNSLDFVYTPEVTLLRGLYIIRLNSSEGVHQVRYLVE
jgi:hypothetical protein